MKKEYNDNEKYTKSEQRLNSEQSNLNENNRALTLSQATYYNQEKHKKSSGLLVQGCCGKFRYTILKSVKNVYFQLIIILLSVYSLIDKELLLLCLPKTYDYTFHRIIECVFCMYTLEFILLFIGKKNYCGSFDFYLDIFAIISIVTETEVIWEKFMHEVTHSDYSVDSLSSFSNFEKAHIANSVGSKATKYIKLLSILSYIKVIRIAKIARNTKIFSMTLESNNKNEYDMKTSRGILEKINALGIRFRRNSLLGIRKLKNNQNKDRIDRIQKKSRTIHLHVIKKEGELEENDFKEENNFTITPKLEKDNIQTPHKTENIKPIKLNLNDTLHEKVNKKKKNVQFGISEDFKGNEGANTINKFESSRLNNIRMTSIHHLTNKKTLSLFNNDSFNEKKNNDNSLSNNIIIYSKSRSKNQEQSMISEELDDYMDELEEKKIRSRIEVFKGLSQQIKIESNLFLQELKSKESNLEVIDHVLDTGDPNEVETKEQTKDISQKMNSKLEKRMLDNVYKQILFLIILIVVSLPTIDMDFLYSLIYSDNVHLNKHEYCLNLIFLFMNSSLKNHDFLSTLNKTIGKCFSNESYDDSTSGYRNLLYLEFNESNVFYELQNKTGFLGNEHSISISDFHHYEEQYREEVDYYNSKVIFDDFNNFTYIYDNRMHSVVYSITSIASSVFISIILIIATYYAKYTVQSIVILPLDVIFTKLKLNLKHVEINEKNIKILEDQYTDEGSNSNFEMDSFFHNSIMEEISLNHISIDTPLKRNDIITNGLETYFINKSLFRLLDMLSASIGKIAYLLVPYLELERDHFLNLKITSVEFEGFALILNIRNTDILLAKYSELSLTLLSRVYTLFHSIGIIFLGEPYNKTNLNSIIWRKERKDWHNKINKYVFNILNLREFQDELEGLDISNVSLSEKDQIYDMICADLAVFCGMQFLHELYHNLNKTLEILKECNVSVNVYISSGRFSQVLLGDDENLDQIYFGETMQEYSLISQQINYYHKYSSIFLNQNVIPHLSQEIKNYIFPYEYLEINNKQYKIYRHYFNYNSVNKEMIKDNFNYKKMKKEQIFLKRTQFENYILKNNNSFINFVISDDAYVEAVSKLNPTLRSLVKLAHEAFEKKQYDKCLILIRDFQRMVNNENNNYDYIFIQTVFKLEQIVKILKKQITNN